MVKSMTVSIEQRIDSEPVDTEVHMDAYAYGTLWGLILALPDTKRQRVGATVNFILESQEGSLDKALNALESASAGSIPDLARRVQDFVRLRMESFAHPDIDDPTIQAA